MNLVCMKSLRLVSVRQKTCRSWSLGGARCRGVQVPKAKRATESPSGNGGCRRSRCDPDAEKELFANVSRRAALICVSGLFLDSCITKTFAQAVEGNSSAAPTLRPPTEAESRAIAQGLSQIKKSKAPVLLRLVFHDAGTFDKASNSGGSNGSIRLELDRPESGGLKRGW